jgi:hypothetical protein
VLDDELDEDRYGRGRPVFSTIPISGSLPRLTSIGYWQRQPRC